MKTLITSVKGPPLRRILCSFLFGAAAFCVAPTNIQAANIQAPGDIIWVTAGGSIAAYYANGKALPSFNYPVQSYPPPGGIRVSGPHLYAASNWWACCPNKSYFYALLHGEAYYLFTTYNAATGSVITPGFIGAGRAPLLSPTGMSQSGPIFVANARGSIILGGNIYYPLIKSTVTNVLKSPSALAVNGNTLYVTNNAQNSKGNFYISTYTANNGALLSPYFIEIQTGGLNGLALSQDNTTLYVSVYSGSAPGVYTYNATSGTLIKRPFVPVNAPWGIAIEGNTLYVASYQDSAIYEFNATNGGPPFGSIKLSSPPTDITVEPAAALGL